jgi:group II intron reverse transcriptase/maturase
VNLHQKKPVGLPRGETLNDRAASCLHSDKMRRNEKSGERWYCQVKETKRDGTGTGSLSTPIVPITTANRTQESRKREGACRVTGPLLGTAEDSQKSGDVYTKQQRIATLARQMPDVSFMSLAHYVDLEWMYVAYSLTRKDAAAGVDGQTAEEYERDLERNLQSLLDRFKSGSYYAPPVRRVYIPKEGKPGEMRPIGIPTLEDKVLQRAVVMLLEPIYEQEFSNGSYGFRPKRNAHQALEAIWHAAMDMKEGWVYEVDIRKYFDTIEHSHIREFVKKRVCDGVVIRTIGKWLKAGVMENGSLHYNEEGCPQGGVVSPLLSNIYLHEVLDKWFEGEIVPRLQGRVKLVRFADDFVVLFNKEQDARRFAEVLPKRFGKYGLTLHPEKTRLISFSKPSGKEKSETFDFLGFTHYWGTSRRGIRVVQRKTIKKRLCRAVRNAYKWCRENRHTPIKEQHKKLCRKIRGHYGYYGITFNMRSLESYYLQVKRAWHKWLNRRTRGNKFPWELFVKMLEKYPLPSPRIVHQFAK